MLLHMDGFDSYSTYNDMAAEYNGSPSDGAIVTTGGRFGGGTYNAGNYRCTLGKALPSAPSELWMGYAFYITGTSNIENCIASFRNAAGTIEVQYTLNYSTGVFKAYRGNTSLGSSSAQTISVGVWHWLEFRTKINGSTGVVELWLDGTQIINLTGQNTSNSGGTTVTMATIADATSSYSNGGVYFDDWYILDTSGSYNTTRLGDSRIETLKPASDASPNNGTMTGGSGGSHYTTVNENQWDTSAYLTITNTSGQEELFNMTSLSSTPSSISAVRVLPIAQKTDAGSAKLTPLVVSSSATGTGTAQQLTTTWGHFPSIFETDPNTSSAWTFSAVNAAKCGVKVP